MARILLGVSGGISAYKAVELTRLAVKAGHSVRVLQTERSLEFVGRATFEGITGAPVLVDDFETARVDDKDITLPLREFELALLLFNNAGRILTKDFLSKHIWGVIDRKYYVRGIGVVKEVAAQGPLETANLVSFTHP